MKKFQFKITTWEEVSVPDHMEDIVEEKIKAGEITSSSDIYDLIPDGADCETIADVAEQMTVAENGGASTIEILVDGNYTYCNGE